MEKLVGKRYAEALFKVAIELNKLNEFKEEIIFVSDVFEENERLKVIFEHPRLSKDEKKDILNELFKDKVSTEVLNLCYIMVDKGRSKHIKNVSEELNKLANKEQGIVEAKAITAIAMTEEEKENLEKTLSKKLAKQVNLSNAIDTSIVGGVVVEVEGKRIDGSVKGKLDDIYKSLNNIKLTRE